MKHWLILACVLTSLIAGCDPEETSLKLYDVCTVLSNTCDPDGVYVGEQECMKPEGSSELICTTECRVSMRVGVGSFSEGTCYDFPADCDDYYFGCRSGCCEVTDAYRGGQDSRGVEGFMYGQGYCVPRAGEVEIDSSASGLATCTGESLGSP